MNLAKKNPKLFLQYDEKKKYFLPSLCIHVAMTCECVLNFMHAASSDSLRASNGSVTVVKRSSFNLRL